MTQPYPDAGAADTALRKTPESSPLDELLWEQLLSDPFLQINFLTVLRIASVRVSISVIILIDIIT